MSGALPFLKKTELSEARVKAMDHNTPRKLFPILVIVWMADYSHFILSDQAWF